MILSFNLYSQANRILNIPGRIQWERNGGYCGETSIQMIGLYYGNYISQDITRKLAGGEFLVGKNDEIAINALSFTYEKWDYNQPIPQYQNYLIWLKRQLFNYHPVIITLYIKGMSDPDYDHIVPAIGFSAKDISTFNNTDELIFNDCFTYSFYTRSFQSIWDTRSMNNNGISNTYCIPKNIAFGCSITGNKDEKNETKPVHLTIDQANEPDVAKGESPVLLNATITIDSLTIGKKYALLRYNDYNKVPSSGFNPAEAASAIYFTASAENQILSDLFMSNNAVFYRCISYNFNGIDELFINENKFNLYPNPANDYLIIESPKNSIIEIINSKGITIKYITFTNSKNTLDLNEFNSGIYIIKLISNERVMIKKFIKE